MGKLSGAVPVAFVGLHLALILGAVALASREWRVGSFSGNSTHQNSSYVKLGLWQVCVDDECSETYKGVDQPNWYDTARTTLLVSEAALLICVISFWSYNLCTICKYSGVAATVCVILILLTDATLVASVALFGKHTQTEPVPFIPAYCDTKFGYGFYIGAINALVNLVNTICLIRVLYVTQSKRLSYEDL